MCEECKVICDRIATLHKQGGKHKAIKGLWSGLDTAQKRRCSARLRRRGIKISVYLARQKSDVQNNLYRAQQLNKARRTMCENMQLRDKWTALANK